MPETTAKPRLPGVAEDGDITFPFDFPLSTPIHPFGEATSVLTLREPTAQDVLSFGLLNGGVQGETWIKLIHELSAPPGEDAKRVPEGTIKRMAGKDIIKLSAVLSGFFVAASA